MIYLKNATIFTPQEAYKPGALLIDGGHIAAVGPQDLISYPAEAQVIDCTGLSLVPGFIDLQINGAFGLDFTTDPDSIWTVGAKLPQYGLTAFLPTIITAPLETSAEAMAILQQPPDSYQGATPLGLHIEGPFLNPLKRGAHNPNYLRMPDVEDTADWSAKAGVKLVTVAPELPGALDLIGSLVERGVVVSAGHSMATMAEAQAAFAAGVRSGTHLFNAMASLHHREPGLIGALIAQEAVTIGIIPDGLHVHPFLIQWVWQTVGSERLAVVTDAMAALGMPPGDYQLGDFAVSVDTQIARLPDGTLAGSILSPDAALRNMIAFTGCSLSQALPTLTSTPAALLGLDQQIGRLAPGWQADLVLLTEDLEIAATIIQGEMIYQNESMRGGEADRK